MAARRLVVFDTTLRDGEQSPGVALTVAEKFEIARQLSRLGVDVCEAGFPVASDGDFLAVRRIAADVGPLTAGRKSGAPMVICALARAVPADIKRAADAISAAPLRRIHTFLATSDIHLTHKLKISRDECIKRAVAAVSYAKSLGITDIEFSPEDAGRSDPAFLVKVLDAVIEAGATTLNIPDTVGYNTPEEYGALIRFLVDNVKGADRVVFSTHCHNDLGLATANTLAGIRNGASQVEVTINGIGERAGNTSLEEIVMAIHTHPNDFPVYHTIDTYQIYNASQLVTKMTGMVIQPNKAIVGANAFAHESGIHQDGVLKHKATYEIIQPEVLGIPPKTLVLGKHSGRNAFRTRIDALVQNTIYRDHLAENTTAYETLFVAFKKLADSKKHGVSDQDLFALIDDHFNIHSSGRETYRLHSLQIFSGTGVLATATVAIVDTTQPPTSSDSSSITGAPVVSDGRVLQDAAIGHGPVHAIFSAVNRLVRFKNILCLYEVRAVTDGSDSLGKVIVRIRRDPSCDEGDAAVSASAVAAAAEGDSTASATLQQDTTTIINTTTTTVPDTHDHLRPSKVPRLQDLSTFTTDMTHNAITTPTTTIQGQGADEDILVASAKAYINAVNKMLNVERMSCGQRVSHRF